MAHKHRQNRSGGGVGLHVSNDLEFKLREELCLSDVAIAESMFIEIIRPQEKNIIVGIASFKKALKAFICNSY